MTRIKEPESTSLPELINGPSKFKQTKIDWSPIECQEHRVWIHRGRHQSRAKMADSERSDAEKATQSYAALGVGFVCIVLGVPLWWKTTEVYRVQLPYSHIQQLSTYKLEYKVYFTVIVLEESWTPDNCVHLGRILQNTFENVVPFGEGNVPVIYRGNIRKAYDEEKLALKQAKSIEDLDEKLSQQQLLKEYGRYYIIILPSDSALVVSQATLGIHRLAYIKDHKDVESMVALVSSIVREEFVDERAMYRVVQSATGARHMETDKESMRSVRYHPGYEVTFSLFNPQPDFLDVHWDIKAAIQNYMRQFLKAMEGFAEIKVKSQYLHYTGISVRPQRDASGNFSVLSVDNLPHIINPIEGHLSSHVSTNPNLNFVVYMPSRDQSPLYILRATGERSDNNAFLSPRWGGLLVYNTPSPLEGATLPVHTQLDMAIVMETFISQLRLLLGINNKVIEEVAILQAGTKGLSDWELDKWLRSHALENVASSTLTLRSLIQLLEEVGNIVINDHIGKEVHRAVSSIESAHVELKQGRLHDAFLSSRQAILASEKAFFDPSLLELLYFPEDQKFAIYIPLFLPISIPVVLSLMQAIKWVRSKPKVD